MILTNIGMGEASVTALLGYAVVFFGLILLMAVTIILGNAFIATDKKKSQVPAPVAAPVVEAEPEKAPGSAGQLKLHNVEPKTAAMLMAITADKLGKPINELRFISIKEVEQ
jgi:Na+-transporting methylmalonyl-CoA/oxaloacetate decarboxylase gamma subunit